MTRKASARRPWKTFQNAVGEALEGAKVHGLIRRWHGLDDGMRMVRSGPKPSDWRPVAATPQPSDFIAVLPMGQIAIVEAKRVAAKSIAIARPDEVGKWSDSDGVKGHQADWMIDVDKHGGVGLLMVEFECGLNAPVVYSLRGRDIATFLQYEERKSIPLAWFERYGRRLGVSGHWTMHQDDLKPWAMSAATA